MTSSHHVFFDPTGKRRRLLSWSAAAIAVLLSAGAIAFAITLAVTPFLPAPGDNASQPILAGKTIRQHKKELSDFLLTKAKENLQREILETEAIAKTRAAKKAGPSSRITAGFYSTWQATGLESLKTNARKMTHLFPEWLHLNESGDGLDFQDWNFAAVPENKEVLAIARDFNLQIHPVLNNIANTAVEPERVRDLLASPEKQKALAKALTAWLIQQNVQGVVIDFQDLSARDVSRFPAFLRLLKDEFRTAHLAVSVLLPQSLHSYPLSTLGSIVDFVIFLGFNEHQSTTKPGPLSSISWFANNLQLAAKQVPSRKLIVVLANQGVDWPEYPQQEGVQQGGQLLSYLSTLNRAREFSGEADPADLITLDPVSLNPMLRYVNQLGENRVVWFLDATSTYNQWVLTNRAGIRGTALWRMGSEDPGVWSFLESSHGPLPDLKDLSAIKFPYQIDFLGKGEILTAHHFEPHTGERQISRDPLNGLITSVKYVTFPSSVVIERSGFQPGEIALTFDDGPSAEYTEKILDILKEKKVPATFFVIGRNVLEEPEIISRIWDEGHEIGNHTYTHPDMSSIGEERRVLELNTTQRALQSVLGRSTILFRTPYRADVEPRSIEEVKPLQTASKLNYITIGMTIDPQDWRTYETLPDGTRRRRTREELIEVLAESADRREGNVVLLHDGGGDRSATVDALPGIIDRLQADGFKLVKISRLLNLTTDQIMPPVQNKDLALVGFNRVVFELYFFVRAFLTFAFTVVLVFGIARLLFVTSLALVGRARDQYDDYDESFKPPVSVIVAAYNEGKVIARTVQSILQSNYPQLEIVVVDDGSTDDTSEAVRSLYGDDPRVILLTQTNTGKAAALNHGMERAKYDILVCLDADTQLDSLAISLLVRHFQDPKVGAVAGNVKVGNRTNIITQWQSIEYISSQNLDRRAYSLLNAITVVPGAAGAWRRKAVQEAGMFLRDTLAEDMDLTWRIRRTGWTVTTESDALGYTEAPDTVRALFKQRFRWSFGSLQCLWKHRSALFHYGWFGWLGLPTLWLFQIGTQVLAPVVDLQLFYALGQLIFAAFSHQGFTEDWQPTGELVGSVSRVLVLYVFLFVCDLISSLVAFKLDKERIRPLFLLFFQRFAYRQLMYAVVWKALVMALIGFRQGWGKLHRTGTVTLPKP